MFRDATRRTAPAARVCGMLGAALLLGGAPAAGQERPKAGGPLRAARVAAAGAQERGDRPAAERPARPSRAGILFGPTEQDWRPLEAGEDQQLLDFARQHLPRMHQRLIELRGRDRVLFRQQLERFAAQLRMVRRLHARDPRLARMVVARMDNEQRLQRLRRAWHQAGDPARRRLAREARAAIAENMKLEAEVIRLQADLAEQTRAERIDDEMQRLTTAAADDLAAEPPPVRRLLDRLNRADDAERPIVEAELRAAVGRLIDDEIAAIRERLRRREARLEEEVDRRVERFFSEPVGPGP